MYMSQVDNEEYMHSHETTCMERERTTDMVDYVMKQLAWRMLLLDWTGMERERLPTWWVMS